MGTPKDGPSRIDAACTLHDLGHTKEEIAREMGLGVETVAHYLRQHRLNQGERQTHEGGYRTRRSQAEALKAEGRSLAYIAEVMGVTQATARRYCYPTPSDKRRLPLDPIPDPREVAPDINEMVRWRDRHGIIRFAKVDEAGNPVKSRPVRKWLRPWETSDSV